MSLRSFSLQIVACVGAITVMLTGCGNKAEESAPAPSVSESVTAPTETESAELFTEPLQEAKDPSEVLATVNETTITRGELDKEIDTMLTRMQGRVPPERIGQMRAQLEEKMLGNLVNRRVLLDKVAADKIEVSEDEFNTAIEDLKKNLPPDITMEQMLERSGTTEAEFRENFGIELKIRKLIEGQNGEKLEATEEEAKAFYDENPDQFNKPESATASHILISVEEGASDEDKAAKRAELESIRTKIVEGADFAEMAKEHSSCPSKAQGGDLGEFGRGRMVPEFEQAAFSQEINAVGDIVETQFGYHIIKVTKRDQGGATPFEEVKEQLTRYLTAQKQQKAAREYIDELVKNAKITYPDKK